MAKREIKMLVSMAGPDQSYDPGQTYKVDEPLAIALCTLPEDGPRAEPVGWNPAGEKTKRIRKPKTPTPPAAASTPETAPKAETATRSRRSRAAKPKPEQR